jgi:acetoin utilization protein AcuC
MTATNDKLHIAYGDDYLKWQLGSGDGSHPTKPIRAKLATNYLTAELGEDVVVIEPEVDAGDRERLESIHSPAFVSEVLDEGKSNDWYGEKPELGQVALQMFAGTARLTEKMLANEIRIGFNPQGAKHHAQYGWSEGFCVFNDFAWAALEFQKAGLRPVYIDWDVNAGDGVQNILEDSGIPTFSIHGHGIYPIHSDTWIRGQDEHSYLYMNAEKEYYNYALQPGEGDEGFAWAIDDIATRIADYKPDVILLATGADGHEGENWGLKYTYEGYRYASSVVADLANRFTNGRVLIGGAGGYQAETHTPRIWANVVSDIYNQTREAK